MSGCGTFELLGNGKLGILTKNSPKKSSPDYAIVAKNTLERHIPVNIA